MTRGDAVVDIITLAIAGYFLWLWYGDLKQAKAGNTVKGAMPGASLCGYGLLVLGIGGALLLVALETGGEYLLQIVEEQQTLKLTFLASMLGAAIVEEVIFRGYLVVQTKGTLILWMSILGFSLLFALIHPYLWHYDMGDARFWELSEHEWAWQFNSKGYFSTAFVFLNSIWFYALRFMPMNATRSLLPCFIAHATSNLAVFAVKAVQGYVEI